MTILRRMAKCLLVFLLLPKKIAESEEVSGALSSSRKEVANASQILDRILKKRFYDKKTRPNVTGGPEIVNVSIGVKSFSEIKESNMEFQVFMYLRQEWTDKRLAHGLDASLALSGTDVQRMWLPDTYFTNANEHEVFTSNQLVLIDKKGQIYYSAYIRVAGACQMDLVKFPMDVQQCQLTLESFAYTIEQMDYQWKSREPIRILNEELAEFDVVKFDLTEKKVSYVSGCYKDLGVTFTFHRRMGFYFIQFYIPCIVMVSLSWISFWMDRFYIGERLSLGITTILTIVFLLGSSNSTMPRVSYAKAIDWYLLGSFIFVFSTLVTDLLVYRLRSKEEGQEEADSKGDAKIVFQCKHGFKPNYVADANGHVHLITYKDNSSEDGEACLKELRTCIMGCTQPSKNKKTDLSALTNKCCRYMFPISFAIFNLIYWLTFSTGT